MNENINLTSTLKFNFEKYFINYFYLELSRIFRKSSIMTGKHMPEENRFIFYFTCYYLFQLPPFKLAKQYVKITNV